MKVPRWEYQRVDGRRGLEVAELILEGEKADVLSDRKRIKC